MYGNPTFDCDGAGIRAHCRQLATVVTIVGDLDVANVDRATRYTRRFILAEKPFVLDLERHDFLYPGSSFAAVHR